MESQKTCAELKLQCKELDEIKIELLLEKRSYDNAKNKKIKSIGDTIDILNKEMKIHKSTNQEKYEELKLQHTTLKIEESRLIRELWKNDDEHLKKRDNNELAKMALLKEIEQLENMENIKNMIDDNIKNIEGFHLLNENELIAITSNMDKTDYRKYDKTVSRWLDLEKIIKRIIQLKIKHPEWTIVRFHCSGQLDCLPPIRYYAYSFSDNLGSWITIRD